MWNTSFDFYFCVHAAPIRRPLVLKVFVHQLNLMVMGEYRQLKRWSVTVFVGLFLAPYQYIGVGRKSTQNRSWQVIAMCASLR